MPHFGIFSYEIVFISLLALIVETVKLQLLMV